MSRSTIRGNARRTRGGELRSLEGGFIPWWDRRDIGEFRANIEYIRRYIVFGKIVGGLENFSRFLFWSFFRKKREREREMYVSREGSRSILEYLSRNFWNWKFLESLFQSSFRFLSNCLIFLGNGRILDRERKLYWKYVRNWNCCPKDIVFGWFLSYYLLYWKFLESNVRTGSKNFRKIFSNSLL